MTVDLDAVGMAAAEGQVDPYVVLAMVSELQAARVVLTFYDPPHCSQNCTCAKATAWRAYKAVAS